VGQSFASGGLQISMEEIKAFAAAFEPQPFHLDEEAAQDTIFKGLAEGGWRMAALTMRLLVQGELNPADGVIGASFDEFSGPRPVRSGDESLGSSFFMITGFLGFHDQCLARRLRHRTDRLQRPSGPPRDRRDHGPLLAFRRSGVGPYLRVLLSLVRAPSAQAGVCFGATCVAIALFGKARSPPNHRRYKCSVVLQVRARAVVSGSLG
jgi:hypothetical protein